MRQQALIIGLGQFGMALSRALVARGVEVLAIDQSEDRVRAASSIVTEAACFDATDEQALARTSPERRDVCVVSIGDESREASIICTALLRQMGAKRLIARSNDDLHARILTLVGANHVVNPEREFGERFANQIVHEEIRGEMPLGEGVLISEVEAPGPFLGKALRDLQLPSRYGITVVAIRKGGTGAVVIPGPESKVETGDVLVVVAKDKAVARMMEEN